MGLGAHVSAGEILTDDHDEDGLGRYHYQPTRWSTRLAWFAMGLLVFSAVVTYCTRTPSGAGSKGEIDGYKVDLVFSKRSAQHESVVYLVLAQMKRKKL